MSLLDHLDAHQPEPSVDMERLVDAMRRWSKLRRAPAWVGRGVAAFDAAPGSRTSFDLLASARIAVLSYDPPQYVLAAYFGENLDEGKVPPVVPPSRP